MLNKKINWGDIGLMLAIGAVIISVLTVAYGEFFIMPSLNAVLQ